MATVKNLFCSIGVVTLLAFAADAQVLSKKDLKGRIVFASDRAGNWDIWIMNADASDPRQLTSSDDPEVDPAFSPDGKKILFSAKRGDENEVWVMDSDGSNPSRICEGDQADWAPDGKAITFRREWRIMTRNLETGEEKTISPRMWSHCVLPAWSPDGKGIAFAARLIAGYSIYIQNLSKPKPEKLSGEGGACEPHWFPDGRLIAFQDESHIYTIEPTGRNKYQVTTGGGVQHYPEWSPDGKFIVYCQAPGIDGPWQICVVDSEGGAPIQLTDTASNMNPDWHHAAGESRQKPEQDREAKRPEPKPAAVTVETGERVSLQNEKLLAVFSKDLGGPVIHSKSEAGKGSERMRLAPLSLKGARAEKLTSYKILQDTGDEVSIEVTSRSSDGDVKVVYRLSKGRAFIEIAPGDNAGRIRMEMAASFLILPDFFGDDLVYDPRAFAPDRLTVPSENMLLSLARDGNSILMNTWPPGEQEVEIILRTGSEGRFVEAAEISFDGKSVYAAVLDSPGIWHAERLDKPSCLKKDIELKWRIPFSARWQTDFCGKEGSESWPFEWGRKEKWTAQLGTIIWPCWREGDRVFVRLLGERFLGPVVIYPIERDRDTPLTVYTPADVMRETLGVGPCEYVLDAEGLKPRPPGGERELLRVAVCSITYTMEGFFWRGLEVRDRQVVCDLADDAAAFIQTVNARIQEYRNFAREILDLCEKVRKDSPKLAPAAEKIAGTANQIEKSYQDRLSVIKTPSDSAKVAEQVKALTVKEDPENLGRYLELAAKLRHIAGTQDGLMGRCRLAVKRLRQEAALATATHPEAADFAARLREQTRQILRKKHSMEGK